MSWLAMNKSGRVNIYKNKPTRERNVCWSYIDNELIFVPDWFWKDKYPLLCWETEPIKIEL